MASATIEVEGDGLCASKSPAVEHGEECRVAGADDGQARFEPKRRGPFTAALDGFNVQAAVRIPAMTKAASGSCGTAPALASRSIG